jgi:tetratricopeptide (TPR) repeat protein
MTNDRQGQVVTFYSFKGGTGRTMALANIAWILASSGKRVLVVDWDLESPGLDRFFHPFIDPSMLASSGGVIKMIREYEWQSARGLTTEDWHKQFAQVQDKAFSLKWDHFPGEGSLDILTTGRQNLEYHENLGTLNWDDFYERLGGGLFFDALREDMKAHYDYTLIDSRTGFSDVAEICTIHLPDTLVSCFTFTDQGIEGSARVASSVQNQYGSRNIRILPVPMRVDPFEMAKVQAGHEFAMRRFGGLPAGLTEEARREYWSRVQVPYVPYFAYEETLAVFAPDTGPGSVLAAYERLAEYITGEPIVRPKLPEALRARTARRFDRVNKPPVSSVLLRAGAGDELWYEWIEQVLQSTGVQVYTDEPGRVPPAGETPQLLLILSEGRVAELGAQITDDARDSAMGIYVAPISLPALLPENAVSINGLREAEAIDEILKLVGRTDVVPPVVSARFPDEATKLFLGPVKNALFTGREIDLRRLRAELRKRGSGGTRSRPVVLHGMSGVGKTQIALEYTHRYGRAYDLVYWIGAADAGESATFIDQKLNELAPYLGVTPQTTITENVRVVLAALSRGQTPYQRWLLVFDNADDPERDKLFLPYDGGDVLITSNIAGWDAYAHRMSVDVFDRADSKAHLRKRVPWMTDADADRIAETLGDLPIAITNAGALIADTGRTVDEYLREMKLGDVDRTFTLTFERLKERSKAAFRLLQLLSVLAPYTLLDFIYSDPFARALVPYDPGVATRDTREELVQHLSRLALIKIDPKVVPVDQGTALGPLSNLIAETRENPMGGYIHMHSVISRVARQNMTDEELEATRREVHQILVASRPVQEVDDPSAWAGYKALWPHQEASGAIGSDDPAVRQLLIDRVRYIWIHGGFAQGDALAAAVTGDWEANLAQHTDQASIRALQTDILRLQFNHANILRSRGYYRQSFELSQHVVAEQTRLLGERHAHTLRSMGGLGGDLRALGRYAEALAQDERTHAAWLESGPENRVQTLSALNNLGVSNRLMGYFQKALEIDREVLTGRRRTLPENHPDTFRTRSNVGRGLREVGQYRQSIDELEKVTEAFTSRYGPESLGALQANANYGVSLRTGGRADEAEAMLTKVYRQLSDTMGAKNPETLACQLSRALALLALDRVDEAREDLTTVRDAYAAVLEPTHPLTLSCENNLAAIACIAGEFATAKQIAATTTAAFTKVLRDDHPYTLAAKMNLAIAVAEEGDFTTALAHLQDVSTGLVRTLGQQHPDTLRCEANLALVRIKSGGDAEANPATIQRRLAAAFGSSHPAVAAFRERQYLHRTIDPHPF